MPGVGCYQGMYKFTVGHIVSYIYMYCAIDENGLVTLIPNNKQNHTGVQHMCKHTFAHLLHMCCAHSCAKSGKPYLLCTFCSYRAHGPNRFQRMTSTIFHKFDVHTICSYTAHSANPLDIKGHLIGLRLQRYTPSGHYKKPSFRATPQVSLLLARIS